MRLLPILYLLAAPLAHAVPVELTHQARLLDAVGAPVNGTHTVTVALYGSLEGGTPISSTDFVGIQVDDGYVSVNLPVDTDDLAASAIWVGYSIDATPISPRQPLTHTPWAARALVADRLPTGTLPTGACTDIGRVSFDPDLGLLSACGSSGWAVVGGTPEVRLREGAREWSDGSVGRTCDDYRRPPVGFSYSGADGSGYYRIDPDGNGSSTIAYCDMETDDTGWTLCFAYDTSTYDSANWPSTSAGRNKLLAQTWGTSELFGSGSTQGNFCNQMVVNPDTTQLRAEVTRVDNNAVLWSDDFTVRKADFFTQVHDHAALELDCLVSNDGGSRLMYANYLSPGRPYNARFLAACSGSAGQHLVRNAVDGSNNGVDTALIMADFATGSDPSRELSLQVNWYSDFTTNTLHTSTGTPSQTKFGLNATWTHQGGRTGSTTQYPGPNFCYTQCGHTNLVTVAFKQRLWVR